MNGINEWMMQANEQQCLNELLAQPEEEAALTLTGAQALQLLETRRETLHREGLVEWGEGILPQLAKRFEQSAYLDRQTYAESLERLAALFYHCRAQAGERVTDEQILELLSTRFEGICGGDFERLEELAQEFLQLFPEPLAVRTLLRFDPDYRRQFYNLERGAAALRDGHGTAAGDSGRPNCPKRGVPGGLENDHHPGTAGGEAGAAFAADDRRALPPLEGGVPLSCAGTAWLCAAACGDQRGGPWASGGVHGAMNSPETKKQCLAFYIGNVRYCRNSLFDRLFIKKSIQARVAQAR